MPAVAARHSLLDRIEATEGRPINEITVPFRPGAGGIECGLHPAVLKPVVSSIPHITTQRIGIPVIPSGGHEGRHGRCRSVRQDSTACRLAGPVGHTSRIVHYNQDVWRGNVGDERWRGRVVRIDTHRHSRVANVRNEPGSDDDECHGRTRLHGPSFRHVVLLPLSRTPCIITAGARLMRTSIVLRSSLFPLLRSHHHHYVDLADFVEVKLRLRPQEYFF